MIRVLIVATLFLQPALAQDTVQDTQFSTKRGLYYAPTNVAITTDTPGATIRYTLDGSAPTPGVGTIYGGPIPITNTMVLRAIAYRSGMLPTDVDTQTYIFPDSVVQQPASIPGWPQNNYSTGPGSATHDYEMDPGIVNDVAYQADLLSGLREIPTLSIVMDENDFWAMNDGNPEREASVELIYPDDPEENEQVDCGIKGHSHQRLKRSYRLMFRREYGAGNFRSTIFQNALLNGHTSADDYNRIVLRGGNNRAWSRDWNADRTTFCRDEWFRSSQVAMSGFGSRGVFVHLYVNGIYWGLYNPTERPDAAFSASHFGGNRPDWASRSHGGVQNGNQTRWNYLTGPLEGQNMTVLANYNEMKTYLDLPAYCDYLIVAWMTGVDDWPNNNYWGGNWNNPGGLQRFYGWDCEWAWDTTGGSNQGAWVHPDFRASQSGGPAIASLWHSVRVNNDFMMLFADRVYKNCFNNGPVSDDRSRERWAFLNDFIRNAVVGESARWGDAVAGNRRERDDEWQSEVTRLDGLMNGNAAQLLSALRGEGFYPSIDPPVFRNSGAEIGVTRLSISAGFQLRIRNDNGGDPGSIKYTLDGTDPRADGGADQGIDGGDN
ncbi:MAG: chitobiase/beta-hexosaminidase C-terminal domain-containing protein, partial [Verrucomicrobiota bacterium]